MVLKIVPGFVALVVLVAAYAETRPAEYVVTRETRINAPAEEIFPLLNSAKLADQWAGRAS